MPGIRILPLSPDYSSKPVAHSNPEPAKNAGEGHLAVLSQLPVEAAWRIESDCSFLVFSGSVTC